MCNRGELLFSEVDNENSESCLSISNNLSEDDFSEHFYSLDDTTEQLPVATTKDKSETEIILSIPNEKFFEMDNEEVNENIIDYSKGISLNIPYIYHFNEKNSSLNNECILLDNLNDFDDSLNSCNLISFDNATIKSDINNAAISCQPLVFENVQDCEFNQFSQKRESIEPVFINNLIGNVMVNENNIINGSAFQDVKSSESLQLGSRYTLNNNDETLSNMNKLVLLNANKDMQSSLDYKLPKCEKYNIDSNEICKNKNMTEKSSIKKKNNSEMDKTNNDSNRNDEVARYQIKDDKVKNNEMNVCETNKMNIEKDISGKSIIKISEVNRINTILPSATKTQKTHEIQSNINNKLITIKLKNENNTNENKIIDEGMIEDKNTTDKKRTRKKSDNTDNNILQNNSQLQNLQEESQNPERISIKKIEKSSLSQKLINFDSKNETLSEILAIDNKKDSIGVIISSDLNVYKNKIIENNDNILERDETMNLNINRSNGFYNSGSKNYKVNLDNNKISYGKNQLILQKPNLVISFDDSNLKCTENESMQSILKLNTTDTGNHGPNTKVNHFTVRNAEMKKQIINEKNVTSKSRLVNENFDRISCRMSVPLDVKERSPFRNFDSVIKPCNHYESNRFGIHLNVHNNHNSCSRLLKYRSLTPEITSNEEKYSFSSDKDLQKNISNRSQSPYNSTRMSYHTDSYKSMSNKSHSRQSNRYLSDTALKFRSDDNYSYSCQGMRRRVGSDSYLYRLDKQDKYYHTRWRVVNSSSISTIKWKDDFSQSKELFRRLYFCVRLIDQNVPFGSRVKFWCCVTGFPEPKVEWYREGQKLNNYTYNASMRYQTKYDNGIAQLVIENAQNCDTGEYTCVAMNTQDRVTTRAFLTVYTSPTVFGASLITRQLTSSFSNNGYKSKYFDKLHVWNSDDLRLKTKYDWHSLDEISKYPKFISSILADDVATYGGTIALQVKVQGSPMPNITWSRESKPLPLISNKYIYLDEGNLYTLLVRESTVNDSGTYICRACNLYGSVHLEKHIKVVSQQDFAGHRGVKPAIIVSKPNSRLSVTIGEDINISFRVAGEPKPQVIWMKGAKDITFLDRSSKETVNDYVKLSIKRAQLSDAGTYFIIAKNVYGSDRIFVTVGVRKRARSLTPPRTGVTNISWSKYFHIYSDMNEVPGPIKGIPRVSDRGKNRISLEWDKPEKNVAVLVYKVEAWSDNEGLWKEVGMTSSNNLDIYNLKPNTGYKFRVTARNRFGWGESISTSNYIDIFEPEHLPEFIQPLPGETKVLINDNKILHCHVQGSPKPQVVWFKDGELVTEKYCQEYTEKGKCTLTITNATDEDNGRYVCEATNIQGRICTYSVVEVIANRQIVQAEQKLHECLLRDNEYIENAPNFTKKLINRRVDANETVRLSCQVTGLPIPIVTWNKDGQQITSSTENVNITQDSDNFCSLELINVKASSSGSYTATATNKLGSSFTNCLLEVIIKHRGDPPAPEFIYNLPAELKVTDALALRAQVDSFRPIKAEWFRNGVLLRNGRRVDIVADHEGKLELRIAEATTRDTGVYLLKASNDVGTVESFCDVIVIDRKHKDFGDIPVLSSAGLYSKKPKFVVKPKFQEIEEGSEVIIDSEIVGDPTPKITWLRDGLKPEYYRDGSEFVCLSSGSRYQLKIPHVKISHTGTYTLLASNTHGEIKTLISLQVYSAGHGKKNIMENGINRKTTVERLPRISRPLVDVVCSENDIVSFECKLNITPEADIKWQKDGKLVRLGKEFKSELVNGDTARLEITKVNPSHVGVYTCTAYNELGQDSTSARLKLLDSDETNSSDLLDAQKNTMISSPILAGECNERSSRRLKRSSAPKFYAVLHDKIVDVGDTVRFQCSVSGYPPPWSSWKKDGEPIGISSRIRIREDDDFRSLEICDIIPEDAGLYTVTVENKYGKIQTSAKLQVLPSHDVRNDVEITTKHTPRPNEGRKQSGSTACTGDSFTLSCDIRGNSMSDVTWYKNDEEIIPNDRITTNRDDLVARISISNLQSDDTGVYTCIAKCESGVTKCSSELSVFDANTAKDPYLKPPIFVEGLVPKLITREGEKIELPVKLQGAVPMSVTWFKDDILIPDCNDFTYVTKENGIFCLAIADPFNADSGLYSCKVMNCYGEAISYGELQVNEITPEIAEQQKITMEYNNNVSLSEKSDYAPRDQINTLPANILWGPCDTTVMRGARVVLETSYAGKPEPLIQWLRAGKILESNEHLCISNTDGISSLTIESITADDCGKYAVRVDNGLGNDYHYASVAVEGPPDPPAGRPIVSVSETSADVTWSSPAYDGGCMVTGYSVEVRSFNQTQWKLVADKCHSLSHIVRGLAPGESYVFRVRAENMHGSSEASLESVPVYILQTDYGNTVVPKKVTIESGELFSSQYEVLDELGKGRYGVVHKIKDRESGKYLAAKFVRCIKAKDKEKAQEEVDIMNCLRHPKLLQLEAAFENPREVVMVIEYISGGELFERVVADDFTLTEKDCILFTRQICEGVDYMHRQNVVHLDLKPENIMCQSRTSHQIKLIDFGLAQKIQPDKPIRVLFGTPEFIPPEIISYEPIGLESDMWSVGVICYVLLSGLSPFMGDSDAETFTNITKAEFDFDDEAFDAISQDSKDFISSLLIKRKEKRLTAKECLKHKWLAQQDMDMRCTILCTDKLKKFIIRRKWQKTGNAIRALGRMATLSAASKRGGGSGNGSILQNFKMASLSEEDSGGETPPQSLIRVTASPAYSVDAEDLPPHAPVVLPTVSPKYTKTCDARSDSGISDCSSLTGPPSLPKFAPDDSHSIREETPSVDNVISNLNCVKMSSGDVTKSSIKTKENRMIFEKLSKTSECKSKDVRKEPIRLQTTDNFKKAIAFWKQ
ncbi:myosin light chain kinase, smooth muscle-like isoform X2 [Daktulosphaira vitifoliae]|nr:myosin light chain kinase, smooth muscle-like isoform X2 [Daktulosphaira vitifoliae]XP_050541448.1 myosin light chain kinase, smooth muscle-like isoform X2 [Daktulosphaira vitifoliae]